MSVKPSIEAPLIIHPTTLKTTRSGVTDEGRLTSGVSVSKLCGANFLMLTVYIMGSISLH